MPHIIATRKDGGGRKKEADAEDKIDIKSSNPHLTGSEKKHCIKIIDFLTYSILYGGGLFFYLFYLKILYFTVF